MKRKQNQLGIYMMVTIFAIIGFMCPKMITFAGGINGSEAGVISAASGTFSYNGKTYRAGSQHISSLTNYLASDEIDLTPEQASEAIGMMYGSIADGVAQGYLYEVGDSTTEQKKEDSTEKKDNQKEEKKEENKKDQTDQKEQITEETKTEEEKKEAVSKLDVWDTMSNETNAKDQLKKRPDKKKATTVIEMEEDQIVLVRDDEICNISKTASFLSKKVIRSVQVASIGLLVATLLMAIILFATKCMRFVKTKKRTPRPGHSKRRKIRRFARYILTGITMISMFGLLSLIGIHVSFFHEDAIMQNMQASGYFRYAYSEYIAEQSKDAEFDEKKILPYEEYLFTIKQNSMKILNGDQTIDAQDSNIAPYIYNMKSSFLEIFRISGWVLLANVILAVILMIFMDQRRNRGVKNIALSTIFVSVILAIATVVLLVYKPYIHFYIEPDYLYLFMMEAIRWSIKVMIGITAFTVVIGALLMGVYKTTTLSKY